MSDPPPLLRFDGRRLVDDADQEVVWPELAVLGSPVAHSSSPRLHAAALAEIGVDHRYRAVQCEADGLRAALEDAHAGGVRGLNLTLPHKEAALAWCARVSSEAQEIGAANTLVRLDEGWMAHNTDARGLAMALQRALGAGLEAATRRVAVLGAGGAARAAVQCLRALGAREIRVVARRPERAAWSIARGAEVLAWRAESLEGVTLLLDATPLGLDPRDPLPLPLEGLRPGALVMDLVYGPAPSALLREASRLGLAHQDGSRMLVGQAALAFGMWYGGLPPVEAMARAVGLDW